MYLEIIHFFGFVQCKLPFPFIPESVKVFKRPLLKNADGLCIVKPKLMPWVT